MVCFAVLGVDLAVEGELDVVGHLFCIGVAGEGEGSGGQIDLGRRSGDIGRGDGEVDEVASWV